MRLYRPACHGSGVFCFSLLPVSIAISTKCLSGDGYRKTANAWLALLDGSKAEARRILGSAVAVVRWRIFFIVTAETWGHKSQDWGVSWYLFRRVAST